VTSAVIIRARLPDGLEALRRKAVVDAGDDMPAHVTLLYPFVRWDAIEPGVGDAIAAVAARNVAIRYRVVGPRRWPDTIYAGLEPGEPFVILQADLAATFPDHPIYGSKPGFVFVPHITVAEGPAVDDPRTIADPAWAALPTRGVAESIELIATDGGPWYRVWTFPLGGAPPARRR
jgi:hypothetical protein